MYRDGFIPRYTFEDTGRIKAEAKKKYASKLDLILKDYDAQRGTMWH